MSEPYEDRHAGDIALRVLPKGFSGGDAWLALILALAFFLVLHTL